VKQYEIRWATLPDPIGRRPVLLLSRTAAMSYLSKIIVSEITATVRHIPQEVQVGRREKLFHPSVANMDSVHVVQIASVGDLIGNLAPGRHGDVKRALGYALDWVELKTL
jgi:mRNA interferase MazF